MKCFYIQMIWKSVVKICHVLRRQDVQRNEMFIFTLNSIPYYSEGSSKPSVYIPMIWGQEIRVELNWKALNCDALLWGEMKCFIFKLWWVALSWNVLEWKERKWNVLYSAVVTWSVLRYLEIRWKEMKCFLYSQDMSCRVLYCCVV